MYARPDFPEEVTAKHVGLIVSLAVWTLAVALWVCAFFSFSSVWEGSPFSLCGGRINIERLGCLTVALVFLALVATATAIDYTHY